MTKILAFSGGSTKGVGIAAIGVSVMERYNPDVIIGMSVSAIFAIPLAMKKNTLIKRAMLSFELKDIFGKNPPLNKKNNFISWIAFFRIIRGKTSLGKQDELIKYIGQYLTEDLFNEYKVGSYPIVYVATCNYSSGLVELHNLKKESYTNALRIIQASCNLPILINGINLNNYIHFDAGIVRANASIDFIKNNIVSECISIYATAEEIPKILYKEKNILDPIKRTLSILIKSISVKDIETEYYLCKEKGIKLKQIFFKTSLDSLYDTDIDERIIDWNNGIKQGEL